MKLFIIVLTVGLFSCSADRRHESKSGNNDSTNGIIRDDKGDSAGKRYSNARFRNVTVDKDGPHQFVIQGEAQIFEASFGWAVEDGHQELKKGFEMTDAGAPEWGKFRFTVEVQKQRPNSTLTLVLFESSAKDGMRQYELPVVLE